MAIRIGIMGYGNLGRGVELAIRQNEDMTLAAVFTRRDPKNLTISTENVPVYHADRVAELAEQIDVLILCGGSATDLPVQTPAYARLCNVVDSFDTHADIPAHFARVDAAAQEGGKLAIISAGWDPGLFSLARAYAGAVLPEGQDYTFWGRGVSQGHSDAIRRIPGVVDARQYTVPVPEALAAVRSGQQPQLTTRQKHTRECYVVAAPEADRDEITRQICQMPKYFADYDTTVTFVSAQELAEHHSALPHGGVVIRSGVTGENRTNRHTVEYSLQLDSNPEFTSSVLVSCARAAYRLSRAGQTGCRTILDLPPSALHPASGEELRRRLL